MHDDQRIHSSIVDLVLPQRSSCPVCQRLLLAYLSIEDFKADMGKVAVLLLRIDGFEELASIYNVAELEIFSLLCRQA